jgi:hypothetical protein
LQRVLEACRDSLQHRQIEVDHIPAREHVRVERPYARAELLERGALVAAADGPLGHADIAAIHDQHFVEARGVHGNREQAIGVGIGFYVEGQHPRLHLRL